jgi:hypothetical protein
MRLILCNVKGSIRTSAGNDIGYLERIPLLLRDRVFARCWTVRPLAARNYVDDRASGSVARAFAGAVTAVASFAVGELIENNRVKSILKSSRF